MGNIVFCFDKNMWPLAVVALTSLTLNSRGYKYQIFCIVAQDVDSRAKEILMSIVRENAPEAEIAFLDTNNDFHRYKPIKFPIGVMYKLMAVKLLPELDKLLYSDVDVIFTEFPKELFDIDIEEYYIAAAIDFDTTQISALDKRLGIDKMRASKRYINSGVVLFNSKNIREDKIYDKWVEMSALPFNFPDQDILNYACQGKILYLDRRYNDIEREHKNPVIIHYASSKPWIYRVKEVKQWGDLWWDCAIKTPAYPQILKSYCESMVNGIVVKKYSRRFMNILCAFVPLKRWRIALRIKYQAE